MQGNKNLEKLQVEQSRDPWEIPDGGQEGQSYGTVHTYKTKHCCQIELELLRREGHDVT